MSQLPIIPEPGTNAAPVPDPLPDYLPARMLNEFVYCPRLFYYEWVEGLFAHNRETVEGALRHAKLDSQQDALTPADELAPEDRAHSRSVMLSSDTHKLIAKIDLVEAEGSTVTAVDYKRGAPRQRTNSGDLEAWPADRVQVAVQALVLRDNGYSCQEAVVYYVKTKQRVRVAIDDALIAETLAAVADARAAALGEIPTPLVDSPKCPRCSLVGICLPDETRFVQAVDETTAASGPEASPIVALRSAKGPLPSTHQPEASARTLIESGSASVRSHISTTPETAESDPPAPRRLVAARDDLRPLYLNAQGLTVGKSGNLLKVKEGDSVVQEVRIGETCQVNVFGSIQLTTQAIQTLCQNEVPIAYFSQGGWFYGMTQGLGVRNISLRREQFRLADDPEFCLGIARRLVAGKIRNQRTMLQRNHVQPPAVAIAQLKCLCDDAENAESSATLLGIEGNAARIYFENFSGMIKAGNARTPNEDLAEQLFALVFGESATDNPIPEDDQGSSTKPVASGIRDDVAGTLRVPPAPSSSTKPDASGIRGDVAGTLRVPPAPSSSTKPDATGTGHQSGLSLRETASRTTSKPKAAAMGGQGPDQATARDATAVTKTGAGAREPELNFDFTHRNRRPPRDPVNALLSLAYSVLAKDLTIVCHAVGFDPFIGMFHQPRFGRAPLPLDLMEPFRPLIADSAVLSAINTRMVTPKDFIRAGQSVALRPDGRKAFFRAYEQRMDTLVTHPLFGYRLNYRRMLEIQTRLLARTVTGEINTYPVFVTR